ncbi:MAG: dTDP-4-dehydrorhamnose reductase [Clostridia bacterium]|nr:dTDP-4-dehydrorhamnose reductase [Clostridia bacterium]MBQ8739747.1 dTDP-4-dehydrorhamnose reductase [Clostridia bacterium]
MKILVTGAKGQLGIEIRKCFERGYTELGTPEILKCDNDVDYVDIDTLDISSLEAVRGVFEANKYDAVINCAAYTNVNMAEGEGAEVAFKANAIGPRNLAIVCEENGAKLIHVSTDYVFAGDASSPYREYDATSPKSVYGGTKLLGEQYIREQCSRYFIVRTSWLYGYYGKNFVKTMMNIARERGECKVVCDQRGNPTNACDLAHHLLKLVPCEEYGIYHGTGEGECSWYEFTQRIVEFAGIDADVSPCTSDDFPSPVKRPAYSALDNMAFRATVGNEFRHWEDALLCFIENYKGE